MDPGPAVVTGTDPLLPDKLYSGVEDGDPAEFIEEQERVWEMFGVPSEHSITLLGRCLEGTAKRVFRTLLTRFGRVPSRWGRVKEEFIARFQGNLTLEDRFWEMDNRKQLEGESLCDYVTDKEVLFRKFDRRMSQSEMCYAIQKDFLPHIAYSLQAHRFTDVPDLLDCARRVEDDSLQESCFQSAVF